MLTKNLVIFILFVLLSMAEITAWASSESKDSVHPKKDLLQLSLEELMNVAIVSASKK